MGALTIDSVAKRQSFLIKVYNKDQRPTMMSREWEEKKRAEALLWELRKRYNWENKAANIEYQGTTKENVTGNGKYSCD